MSHLWEDTYSEEQCAVDWKNDFFFFFFFFYFKSGFNEPTGKSEETLEMKHLRKSSITEAKNALMQEEE